MCNVDKLAGKFCHLHAHSSFSTKDGSIGVRTLVDRQIENGAPAVAVTDHGMMTGGWFLYDYIHNVGKKGVKHIIGLEAYISPTRDELMAWLPTADQVEDKDERAAKRKLLSKKYHQILLAKNEVGYYNLVKIHNDAWLNGFYYSPTTTPEFIFQHKEGIIATTTCLASIWNQAILAGDLAGAEREMMRWKEAFGEDFYVELQPTNGKTQALVNKELIKLAKKCNIQLIITNDVHYVDPGDHELHSILLNMEKLKSGETDPDKLWEFDVTDLYIKSLKDMHDSWKKYHKDSIFSEALFEETVHTIGAIVDKVEHYTLEDAPSLPNSTSEDPVIQLRKAAVEGFRKKIAAGLIPRGQLAAYEERMIYELGVIEALQASAYFNVVGDLIEWCKENDILTSPGRGCFVPESLVELSSGEYVTLADVRIGDKVKNHFTGESVVVNKFEYQVDEDLIELDFGGGKVITCTADHRFLTRNRGWVEAQEISYDDDVVEI